MDHTKFNKKDPACWVALLICIGLVVFVNGAIYWSGR